MSDDSESTVFGYLAADHDRLDELLIDTSAHVRAGDLAAANRSLEAFAAGLRRHIRLEDEVLFPVFERVTGMTSGPTTVMRDEHRMIERHLDQMVAAVAQGDPGVFTTEKLAMMGVLGEHNAKEESVVYPMTDARLRDAERAALVAELRAFR